MALPLKGVVVSGYSVWFPLGAAADGRRLYTLTGVASLTLKGTGSAWLRASCAIDVGIPTLPAGKGLVLEQWAPSVTLNSIANDQTSVDAGWAVDDFHVVVTAGKAVNAITVQADLAVRDVDGFILRLGYAVQLVGHLAVLSPVL